MFVLLLLSRCDSDDDCLDDSDETNCPGKFVADS